MCRHRPSQLLQLCVPSSTESVHTTPKASRHQGQALHRLDGFIHVKDTFSPV